MIDYVSGKDATGIASEGRLLRRAEGEAISHSYHTYRTTYSYACINTGLVLLCETALALLNDCRDHGRVMLIPSLYIRVAPWVWLGIVSLVVWLKSFTPSEVLGWTAFALWIVLW